MNQGVLYLTYTGLLEPLGQSQVLAYQERLAGDRQIHIVSFERPEDLADSGKVNALRERVRGAGIHWHPRRYHKRPSALATLWDILVGSLLGMKLVHHHGLGIVHARSYVASVMALLIKRFTGARYLFDMRGFWADERVDGGLWPRDGRMYRLAKWFEQRFLLSADHVVSLTQAGVNEMQHFDYLQGRMPPTTVISTCADLQRFSPGKAEKSEAFTLGYVGSVGTWYLFDEAVAAFNAVRARKSNARFLIINRDNHPFIKQRLQAAGVPMTCVELRKASPEEVPGQICRMHAGVFFIKPVFSKQASAPTKLAELLGCGIPCLSNTGVGDMAQILVGENVGVAVNAMDTKSITAGVEALFELCADPSIAQRCIATAQRHFSLTEGTARYHSIYISLSN